MNYERFRVSRSQKAPLLDFILLSLKKCDCQVIRCSDPGEAPFRITYVDPSGHRAGIVAYAFFANSKLTKNRPEDEHRFQIKYGSKDSRVHEFWQDPYGLYTTLVLGIDPELRIFVGIDPVLHSPTRFFISVEFKREAVDAIRDSRWHCWERSRRSGSDGPIETVLGATPERFLDYVRFEQTARGLDQGHRFLLAERFGELSSLPQAAEDTDSPTVENQAIHSLATEFELPIDQILDMIQSAPRLKMAVRGWVAEHHLFERMSQLPGVDSCVQLEQDGRPDLEIVYRGGGPVLVECKNVLRKTLADGTIKVDFQKTRASHGDPCSRFYRPTDFHLLAACLHACTEEWEFRYRPTCAMEFKSGKCPNHLNNNVRITDDWIVDPLAALATVSVP